MSSRLGLEAVASMENDRTRYIGQISIQRELWHY
jgi:hypothetical protein